jgi:Flavin containing amine oxidoreductase
MWLLAPSERLGFPAPGSVLGGFVEPFDTCADMSHLISQESWSDPVRSVFYFCNALPGSDQNHNEDPHEIVRGHAVTFLEHDLGRVLPGVMSRYPTCFNWDLVAGGAEGPGIYWRANVEPSDRYVQSIPGSREYRLHPGESGFENLFLAGDWTSCGLDSGCIEAAITSGMVAAREIGRHPSSTEIAGIGRVRRREYVD